MTVLQQCIGWFTLGALLSIVATYLIARYL